MVSFSRRTPKKPSPVFSFLDWIEILCSGCFGKMGHFKRPLSIQPPPPPPPPPLYLLENHNLDLNVKMGNLALYSDGREDEDNSTSAHPQPHPHPPIGPLAWKLTNAHHVGDDSDDIVAFDENDDNHTDHDPYADDYDSDGMFHGLFFMGSEVLTELEMRSPVEECKVVATPVRTPRRSNNSSCASSTRELHLGSWQVPALDAESCSSSGVLAAVSPSQGAIASSSSSANCVDVLEQRNGTPLDMQHRTSRHSEFTLRPVSDAVRDETQFLSGVNEAPDQGQGYRSLIPDDDIVRFSSPKESSGINNKEKVRPSQRPSLDGKRSHAFRTDEECQARVGFLADCTTVEPRNQSHAIPCRAAEKHVLTHDQIPVGSFPNCSSKSDFLIWGRQNNDDGGGRRRARSLTDQDFTELRGCIDLGFVFTQDHIPDLRNTLPALEVCYAIAHGAGSPVCNTEDSKVLSPGSPPISPWRIAGPGDQPQQVKARLRHWAQAVACNVRQAC